VHFCASQYHGMRPWRAVVREGIAPGDRKQQISQVDDNSVTESWIVLMLSMDQIVGIALMAVGGPALGVL
jgi:hypothetical protein